MNSDAKIKNLEKKIDRNSTFENSYTPADVYGTFMSIPLLRGFWYFNIADTSGNILDTSGCGRTLTKSGGSVVDGTVTRGIPSYSAAGGAEYLTRADAGLAPGSSAFTCGAWVTFNDSTPGTRADPLVTKFGNAGNYGFWLRRWTDGKCEFGVSGNGTAYALIKADTTQDYYPWFFVVGRYNPSTAIDLFVNKTKFTNTTSIPASIYATTADLRVASAVNTAVTNTLNGHIACPFISFMLLSDDTLNRIYNATAPAFISMRYL